MASGGARKLRIVIVFPYNVMGGAFRSSYELSNRLVARGHKVDVIFPLLQPGIFRLKADTKFFLFKSLLRATFRGARIRWMPIHFKSKLVFALSAKKLAGYDVIILNHWQVIDWATRTGLKDKVAGCVFAMIRDIEQWAEYNTFQQNYLRSNLDFIAVSRWVADVVTDLNGRATPVVNNGLNFSIFNTRPDGLPRSLTKSKVGVIINDHPMKDMKRLAGILNLLVISSGDFVEIEVVGKSKGFSSEIKVPVVNRGLLSSHELADFYRRQHIFIFTSLQEGWGNPPLEALACGCLVFSTQVGALQSVDLSKYPALYVLGQSRDDERDVQLICGALTDTSAADGQNVTCSQSQLQNEFDWEVSCDQLEQILRAKVGA